jgi:hypothetical protein
LRRGCGSPKIELFVRFGAMNTLALHLERPEHFHALAAALGAFRPHLVLAFGAGELFGPGGPAERLAAALPDAVVAGCSGAGAIAGGLVHDGTLSVAAVRFARAHVRLATTDVGGMDDSAAAGARAATQLPNDGLRHVLLLGPGLDINGSALVAGVRSVLPGGVGISGGLAADGTAFERTYTLAGIRSRARQVVAVGLYGATLRIASAAQGGWQPFGPARQVRRCHANVLFDLDDERALDVYRRYLGEYADGLPSSGRLFPFEILDAEHRPTGLMRTLQAFDDADGSLTLAGEVPPDGHLRLMHATTDRLVDAAEAAAASLRHAVPKAPGDALALIVSCDGRRLVMGDRVDEEVEAVAACLGPGPTLCGFYSYGEIAHADFFGDCRLHNQTLTVTLIAEDEPHS